MAAFVNSAFGSSYTGISIPSLSTGSIALTAGNLVVVLVRGEEGTVTDTLGNVYTMRGQGAGDAPVWIYSCANCLGGTTTITTTFVASVAYDSIVAMQFSGAATSNEFVGAFTTAAPVTTGNTIDVPYNTGVFQDTIVVGLADVFAAGTFTFTAQTTTLPTATYIEPVADHNSASFFYRLVGASLTADVVRATCSTSGAQKNCVVAVFRALGIGKVSLLLGADASIVDEGSAHRPLTVIGNTVRTTAQTKIGPASITFDGTGDWIQADDSPDFAFGSGDFTVEGYFRLTVKTDNQAFMGHWSDSGFPPTNAWFLFLTGGSLLFRAVDPGATSIDLSVSWTPTLGQWYHLAVDRSGTTLRLYIDGAVVATNASFTVAINDCPDKFTIGAIGTTGSFAGYDYNGQADEIRIIKGRAQYAGAFTPSTIPFPRLRRTQGTGRVRASGATIVNLPLPIPVTAGNAVIASTIMYGGGIVVGNPYCQDNLGNTYTLVKLSVSGSVATLIFVCGKITTGGTATVSIIRSSSSGYFEATAIEVEGGEDLGIAAEQAVGQIGNSATPSTPATPALFSSQAFVVASVAIGANQGSLSVVAATPAWFQELENLDYSATVAGEVDSRSLSEVAGTTQSCSWTPTTGGVYASALAVFTPLVPVVVPALIGMTEAAATSTLTANNLIKGAVTGSRHPTAAIGVVIDQTPSAGAIIAQGSTVSFVVSTGPDGIEFITSTRVAGGVVQSTTLDTTGADFLVVWVSTWIDWGLVRDSKNNIWTEAPRRNNGNFEGRFFYCTGAVVGSNHTFFLNYSTDILGWKVWAFKGVKSYQTEVGATGSNVATVASGSVTPAVDGSLILAGLTCQSSGLSNLTIAPSGFALRLDAASGSASSYLIQPVATAVNATWSWIGNEFNVSTQTIVFNPGLSTASARLSQLPIEVLAPSDPPIARVSQVAVETLVRSTAPIALRVSQVAVEVMVLPVSTLPAKVSQVAVEVMILPGAGGVAADIGPFMGGMGGTIWIE